jgi:DeoR family glycerol-3-phosphate regulon repressor
VEAIQAFHFDLFFLGVSGLTPEGAYDYSPEDAEVKRALIERTSRVVVLCDQSKFNRRALVRVAHLAQLDVLVCDHTPKGTLAIALETAGVAVHQAFSGLS